MEKIEKFLRKKRGRLRDEDGGNRYCDRRG